MDEIESGACKKYHDPITGANAVRKSSPLLFHAVHDISIFMLSLCFLYVIPVLRSGFSYVQTFSFEVYNDASTDLGYDARIQSAGKS